MHLSWRQFWLPRDGPKLHIKNCNHSQAKLIFLYFLTASKVKKIQPLSIKIALLTICWSPCSPTSNHHVDWYSLQNSIKNIARMYHNMNVLLDVSSSKFFFPKLLLFLSDHLWHHFTITSKNVDPSRLKNGFDAGVDCFWQLPASPSHPPHRLTKNHWKAGIDPKIIQVSSKPWADHERLDWKTTRHFWNTTYWFTRYVHMYT